MIGVPLPVGAGPRRFRGIKVSCFDIKTMIPQKRAEQVRKHLPGPQAAHKDLAAAIFTRKTDYVRYMYGRRRC